MLSRNEHVPLARLNPTGSGCRYLPTFSAHRKCSKWGMSVAALIRRAHDLQVIDDDAYRDYEIQLSRLGWRTSEPGHVDPEHPALLGRVIELRRTQEHLDDAALARIALMTEPAFRRHYLAGESTTPIMTLNADEN